jgi:phospholipid/cholesterol/gamma-HCH transport system substrate-binding protein
MVEAAVGVFVAAGIAAFFVLAMKVSNLTSLNAADGYRVTGMFENIGGLQVRSPVKAGGVRVGRVVDIAYDSDQYQAEVTLQIDGQYDRFPSDTSASILTSGLLGEQYIGLEPGASEMYLEAGDSLQLTESAMVLERLISQFLYSQASGD